MCGMEASDQVTRPVAAVDSIRPNRRLPSRGTLGAFVDDNKKAYNATMGGLAVVYIAVTFWHDDSPGPASLAALVVLTLLFATEFTARLLDAPSRRMYLRRHWIDAVSCLPIPMIGGSLRLLRLLKLAALARVLVAINRDDRQSWPFLGPVLLIVWLAAATMDWVLEHGVNPGIHNFGDALTWALITATTVGHANVAPVTAPGQILGGLVAFLGIGLLSLASARLTATWLGQGSDDAVAHQLSLVRSELAGLRDALQGGATLPAAGGDGAPMALLAGDGQAVHDGRWHLVGRQGGAYATPSGHHPPAVVAVSPPSASQVAVPAVATPAADPTTAPSGSRAIVPRPGG
jgi:voltage-gated potassium channel